MTRNCARSLLLGTVLAIGATGCSGERSDAEPAEAGVVRGLVLDEADSPVAQARVEVMVAGKARSATTGSDGRFRIALDAVEEEALPPLFFVTFTHADFAADAVELAKGAGGGSYPGPDALSTGGSEGASQLETYPVQNVRLRARTTKARTLYSLQSEVLHLGDSDYETPANSQFQLSAASGTTQGWKFSLPSFDPASWQRSRVRLFARGMEVANELSINGAAPVGVGLTPDDGRAALVTVDVPLSAWKSGDNMLTLTAIDESGSGPDDFEVAYLELELDTKATVEEVAGKPCSTDAVAGLSEQLVRALVCESGSKLSSIEPGYGISLGPNAFPYLQTAALDQLWEATYERPDVTLALTSTLRTLAQQYLLHRSYELGGCALAAKPGSSQHESGLAIDIEGYSGWRQALEAHGFVWYGAKDDVHFSYKGEGAEVIAGESIRAFQKLWNHNHPESVIAVTGVYDAATKSALEKSPAAGFDDDPACAGQ